MKNRLRTGRRHSSLLSQVDIHVDNGISNAFRTKRTSSSIRAGTTTFREQFTDDNTTGSSSSEVKDQKSRLFSGISRRRQDSGLEGCC